MVMELAQAWKFLLNQNQNCPSIKRLDLESGLIFVPTKKIKKFNPFQSLENIKNRPTEDSRMKKQFFFAPTT